MLGGIVIKSYTKKVFILFLAFYFISPQIVMANSGPTFWRGYPSSEMLAVDDNCPIEVEDEKLFFDLSGNSGYDHTIWGRVRASYEMVNPTDKDLSVQMAFPIVSSLQNFSPDDVAITADGTRLPYDLYISDVVGSHGNSAQESEVSFAFNNILSAVSKQTYQAQHFSENEKGKLYTLEVKPTTVQRINFAVDFEFDKEKTRVLTNGFNRYERDEQKVRIASWCDEPETLEILLLGDDVDFNVTAYTDGELKQKTNLFTYKIHTKEVELKSYIMDYVKEYQEEYSRELETFDVDEGQLYNLYGAALDRAFTINEGYGSCYELIDQNYYERVLTLVYIVDFPANSSRNVTVNYKMAGTMDKTKTRKPVYTFDYILNPAHNWSSFGNLDIEIITPEEVPHIVNSSINLVKENDRHYRASFNSLPQQDLKFSIYEEEKISLLDRFYKAFYTVGILIILAVPVGIVMVRRINKRIDI